MTEISYAVVLYCIKCSCIVLHIIKLCNFKEIPLTFTTSCTNLKSAIIAKILRNSVLTQALPSGKAYTDHFILEAVLQKCQITNTISRFGVPYRFECSDRSL